uniref:Uncharacterized protein n=1 Tax=candidate division WOR-3 bacterium TaxID=2052148 RepID=A0A7C3Z2A8_UNCW3
MNMIEKCDNNKKLIHKDLDKNDGLWTRREILARYLLVNADFFKEFGISIDSILEKHSGIKKIRARDWALENESSPSKYNLFFAQSPRGIVPNKVLDYSVHRWGVPLCLPLLLEKDQQKNQQESLEPLIEYLENYPSSEIASRMLKRHERYGLGSAIGDKACHLFIKWYIHTFKLVKRKDNSWGPFSYELPFDSNVGRILFRTGFLLNCADLSTYQNWNVIQKIRGKRGTNYIRVTKIRGKVSERFSQIQDLINSYQSLCVEHLMIKERKPKRIEIQHIPAVLLFNSGYGIGDLDDGLMIIGTKFCRNTPEPECSKCPIREYCIGFKERKDLITDYTT